MISSELRTWLDAHINYERSGPGERSITTHDPERRMTYMRKLLELMDDPQTHVPAFVHVTGTNGKTSTAHMVTDLLLAHGLRTGTYTSPHLQLLNERIAVNDESIAESDLSEALQSIKLFEQMLGVEEMPTYFEILTAAALRHFADAPVDAAVVEVGVGGTFDATNVIDAQIAVVTNIGHDHHNYLGPELADIARQKAGIATPSSPLVTGERDPEMLKILEQSAAPAVVAIDRDFVIVSNKMAVGGRLLDIRTPHGYYEDVFVSAHGAHQGVNAAIALTATETLFGKEIPADIVKDGLGSVRTPGRMEMVDRSPLVVLDGAHNPDAADKLRLALDEELSATPGRIMVVGLLDPHDPKKFLESLGAGSARLLIACRAPSPRAVAPEQIAGSARALGVPVVVVDEVADALKEAQAAANEDDMVVVTGSLYVVGAARSLLEATPD